MLDFVQITKFLTKMADADDLLDYEDEEQTEQTTNDTNATNDQKKGVKGTYVSIHSSGFRDFLLKPEILRAIVDCGFEHPSEGTCLFDVCRWRCCQQDTHQSVVLCFKTIFCFDYSTT